MNNITAILDSCIISRDDVSQIRSFLERGSSENTKRAYRGDITYFMAWAKLTLRHKIKLPVPIALVDLFINDHFNGIDDKKDVELVKMGVKAKKGSHSVNTVSRRIATLSALHKSLNLLNPCEEKEITILLSNARKVASMKGIQKQKKKAITRDVLETMLATCGDSLIDIRDAALLHFAFTFRNHTGFKVASSLLDNLTEVTEGYIYNMPHSKKIEDGEAIEVPILGNAGAALKAWIKTARVTKGKIFRGITKGGSLLNGITDKTVTRIIKRRAHMAGLYPDQFSSYSFAIRVLDQSR